MKIGILTLYHAHNYGAFLQAYALQKTLEKEGHNVEFINYHPKYLMDLYKTIGGKPYNSDDRITLKYEIKTLLRYCRDIATIDVRKKRYTYFEDSIHKYLYESPSKYYSIADLQTSSLAYDVYIAGSDQIWNPKITGGTLDPVFFLSFVPEKKHCIIYAASMSSESLDNQYVPQFQALTSGLSNISMREKSSCMFVEEMSGKNVVNVLDPTLLLNREEWSKIECNPVKNRYDEFLLAYALKPRTKIGSYVEETSKELDLPVKVIGGNIHSFSRGSYVRPEEFLWYFNHANYVITDSFHGTVFSLINKKLFNTLIYTRNGEIFDWRIPNLLSLLGLNDRMFTQDSGFNINSSLINYNTVAERMTKLKKDSLFHLNRYLQNTKV